MDAAGEVVLFDFFGTLVTYEADRTAIAYERTHALMAEWGAELTHGEFVARWDAASTRVEAAVTATLVEHTMHDVVTGFSNDVGLDLDNSRVEVLIDTFLSEWVLPVALVPGADELVRSLANDRPLGVVSNTNDLSMVPTLLAEFGIADCFDHVVLSVGHGYRKPHPSIYEATLDLFGVAPTEAVFVGDSYEADYLGPTDAGMTAFLIDPDHRHDVPADVRLASILDLADRLPVG